MSSILLYITPVSKCIFRNRIYLVLTQHLLMSFLNVVIKLLKSYTSTCTSQSSSVLCRTQTYCFVSNSKITAPQVIYSNSHICFDELSTLPPNHGIACNISLMIIYVPWRQGSFAACVSWQGTCTSGHTKLVLYINYKIPDSVYTHLPVHMSLSL